MNLKMKERLLSLKNRLIDAWGDLPWVRAAGILGATIAGLIFLNSQLPPALTINLSELGIRRSLPTIIIILYFFLVSIFSGDRLRFEKRLRALEQSFRYDNRGTLFNGSEPNIAFRITTFKGIIGGLSRALGSEKSLETMTATGRIASQDFGRKFPEIYNRSIAVKTARPSWEELTFSGKLNAWADYDSATGWGIVACEVGTDFVNIVITHRHRLFENTDGLTFCYFLAGYCESIVSVIVDNHKSGRYAEHQAATIAKIERGGNYTLRISITLH